MVRHYKALLGVVVAAMLVSLPAAAATTSVPPNPAGPGAPYGMPPQGQMAVPGTVNYVEGQVAVGGQTVTQQNARSFQLQPNQPLETGQGRAEVLLMPGVFLRVGENSAVRLVSTDLLNTRVEVLRGQAIVEVDEFLKGSNLFVMMNGSTTRLDKQGLYDFHADTNVVQVFDGKATVDQGDRHKDVNKDHELVLATWKVQHFDAKTQAAQNQLYAWSNVRAEYEAEASMQTAKTIFVNGGFYGPSWYWNPYWDMWGFIPADGIWFSPFGWPFYSPYMAYWGPAFGFGFGYGYHGFVGHPGFAHGFVGHGHISSNQFAARGGFGGARVGGGFAARGFAGGMHGGFGGMHGGGFGGGGRR